MRQIQTTGIIIKKHNFGDSHQYITFYSPTLGRIEAIAKGSKKIKSHFTGHLETLNICNIQLYKTQKSYTITNSKALKTFNHNNLETSLTAMIILEFFEIISKDKNNDQSLFNLLTTTLNHLQKTTTKQQLILETFKIKLLQIEGVIPTIQTCSKCEKKWTNTDKITITQEGQILCNNCNQNTHQLYTLNFNIIKLINYILKENIEKITNINITNQHLTELKNFTNTYIKKYIQKELKSEKIYTTCI